MNKKFELTTETKAVLGITLHRIRALVAFGSVKAGELGGWIEKEENLSADGDAWVSGDARVYGNAQVSGDARVYGNAWVFGAGAIFWVGGVGSRNDTTTFFACKDKKIRVVCGCFFGTLDEFSRAVSKTHGNSEYAKVYMLAIERAKARIDLSKVEGDE